MGIVDLLERLPQQFDLITMGELAEPLMSGDQQPYVLVAMQESGRMDVLLKELFITLEDLQKGRAGQLNMTQKMEDLSAALSINQVPGRNPFHSCSWEKLAWPSMKSLANWFPNLIQRCDFVAKWTETLILPYSMWLPALFNPTSFLTAIKQAIGRNRKFALDNMGVETHMTTMRDEALAVAYPEDAPLFTEFTWKEQGGRILTRPALTRRMSLVLHARALLPTAVLASCWCQCH